MARAVTECLEVRQELEGVVDPVTDCGIEGVSWEAGGMEGRQRGLRNRSLGKMPSHSV